MPCDLYAVIAQIFVPFRYAPELSLLPLGPCSLYQFLKHGFWVLYIEVAINHPIPARELFPPTSVLSDSFRTSHYHKPVGVCVNIG